ncbi:sulfotransferase family 2 domain-containing protein [archaeon]|nr:sulfotransferase family 2 domain-containing protein [archaeon]
MIISHDHKFIFFKPAKVAGTSLELALAQHCGEIDIITPIANLNIGLDEGHLEHTPRNYEGFYEHMTPDEIKKQVGEVWDDYTKITITRNPWDMVVSRWYWTQTEYNDPRIETGTQTNVLTRLVELVQEGNLSLDRILTSARHRLIDKPKLKKSIAEGDFEAFAQKLPPYFTNNNFYFDSEGQDNFDVLLRFENLQDDYDELCSSFGFSKSTLPRAKTKVRKDKKHYSTHYTPISRNAISQKFSSQIDRFGYSFEKI